MRRLILNSLGRIQNYNIKNFKRFKALYEVVSKRKGRNVYALKEIVEQLQEETEEEILESLEPEKLISKRIRQQIVYNSDYNISLRGIIINGDRTEEEIEKAIEEVLRSNQALRKIPFEIEGIEKAFIDDTEDKNLEDNQLYVELNIRGHVTFFKK